MTEEVKKEEVKQEEKKEVQLSSTEQKATEQGWMPKDEWVKAGKNEEDWRSAKEYVDRGELFAEIERLKAEDQQTKRTLQSLKSHHLKVRETAYKEAYNNIKAELRVAEKEEDFGKVLKLRDKLDELKEQEVAEKTEITREQGAGSVAPEFLDWHSKNQWFKINGKDAMSVYAVSVAQEYVTNASERGENIDNKKCYEYVDKRMREEFPDKFKNPARSEVSRVESNAGDRGNRNVSGGRLTDQEEKICRDLVKSGVMTREQYIKELGKYDELHK